jgi:angio-associated migratory cell protein
MHVVDSRGSPFDADCVFCVAMDPTGTAAITGGQDDRALVWRVADQTKLFDCTGACLLCVCELLFCSAHRWADFNDSVTMVAFSHDGSLLATGSMDGVIMCVWGGGVGR